MELEPLVLTPARRLPLDTSGESTTTQKFRTDEDAEPDDHEHDELEGSVEPEEVDEADEASDSEAGDEEDAE